MRRRGPHHGSRRAGSHRAAPLGRRGYRGERATPLPRVPRREIGARARGEVAPAAGDLRPWRLRRCLPCVRLTGTGSPPTCAPSFGAAAAFSKSRSECLARPGDCPMPRGASYGGKTYHDRGVSNRRGSDSAPHAVRGGDPLPWLNPCARARLSRYVSTHTNGVSSLGQGGRQGVAQRAAYEHCMSIKATNPSNPKMASTRAMSAFMRTCSRRCRWTA